MQMAACLPGCEALDPIDEHRYRATLTVGIAAVTGRYEGPVEMQDLDPPNSYRLVVEGRGKPGFIKGGGALTLTDQDGGTRVDVEGDAEVESLKEQLQYRSPAAAGGGGAEADAREGPI